jgi:excisionase family DNA binding protein
MNDETALPGRSANTILDQKHSPGLGDRYMRACEVAELLGFSAATVVDWAERGEIPSFKIGGRLRFREDELAVWLEEQRR